MSLRSLPGLVSGSPRWSIIGSEGSLLNIMVLRSWSLAGPFTDRAAVGRFHPQINFLMPHSVTTRIPVADIADYEHTSALRRNLDQLSNEAGAKLLRALGAKGSQADLRSASNEFSGHCLALTLLGSYLSDAFDGDIRCREEVSKRLAHDVRQGVHARRAMESYQTWFGDGSELSVLRLLGLFDRPVDEQAVEALLKSPAISGLTDSLTDLSLTEWRTILSRLRRARLLAREDPHNRSQLDTHPLVREYFGEQLRKQLPDAWRECNRRLYEYYRAIAPPLPDTFREMEPLFSAVICGCHAGLFREALHEVYLPRIQRGNAFFAANVLGAREALLSVLVHFFEHGRFESLIAASIDEQILAPEDQLFIFTQAAQYLTTTRGLAASGMRIFYERAESLCRLLNRPLLRYVALMGQWRYSLSANKLAATMEIANRVHFLAEEQKEPALMIGACSALAVTHYFSGNFEASGQCAIRGVQIWRSGSLQSPVEDVGGPEVSCLCHEALFKWHLGEVASYQATIEEAIAFVKEVNDMHGLAIALHFAAIIAYFSRNPTEVERLASEVIELSTRHNFPHWLAVGNIFRGWARSASGDRAQGISWIEHAIEDLSANGAIVGSTCSLALKAEALHLADRSSEALEAIREAQALSESSGERWWCVELHRLRAVFLTALGADDYQIEASFCEGIRIAKEQKSVSLEKRAEGTYAEYRRRKASGSERRGFRLPVL